MQEREEGGVRGPRERLRRRRLRNAVWEAAGAGGGCVLQSWTDLDRLKVGYVKWMGSEKPANRGTLGVIVNLWGL